MSDDMSCDVNPSVVWPATHHRDTVGRARKNAQRKHRSNARHGAQHLPPSDPRCGKIRYSTAIAARLALASTKSVSANGERQECRHYFCPTCRGWHLTSMQKFSVLPSWNDVIRQHPGAAAAIADCASIMSSQWRHNRKRFEAFGICAFTAISRASGPKGASRRMLEDIWVWRMLRSTFGSIIASLPPSPSSRDLGLLKAQMMPLARRIVQLHGDQRPSELTANDLVSYGLLVGFMERHMFDEHTTPPARRWIDRVL